MTNDVLSRFSVTPEDDEIANKIYKRFLAYEGSEHIANPSTLRWFAALLREFRPVNILELGAGIGTMTEMMLMGNYGAKTVFTTESNDFCLNALQKNLTNPKDPRLHILTTESDLNKITKPLDLIVGDGGFYSPLEFQNSKPGTILFFDGNRSKLRTIAHDTLTKKQLKCEMQKLGNDEKIAVWRFKHVLGIPLIPTRKKQRVSCWIGFVKPE